MSTTEPRRVSVMPPAPASDHSGDRRRSSVNEMAKRRQSMVVPGGLSPWKRKQSVWRGSISEASAATPPVKLAIENTYRLDPTEEERFKTPEVGTIIKAVLRRFLQDCKYNATDCGKMCKDISQQMTHEIKELGYTRHKLICHVIIGEQKEQGFKIASRCLWNDQTDSYASAEYSNKHLFAVGSVHGIYFE